MVAAKGPSPRTAIYPVCKTIESVWNLRVLCPCRDKDPSPVCHGQCMRSTVRCMGVPIFVSPTCALPHAYPNALDDGWQSKFGAPLQSRAPGPLLHAIPPMSSLQPCPTPSRSSTRGVLSSCCVRPGCSWPHYPDIWRLAGVAIRTLSLFFFFFLLRQPLSDVWWLPTNRHRLPTNRHRLHTNRHRLHTNRHHRAYWTLRVFFIFYYGNPRRLQCARLLRRLCTASL